MAHVCVYLTLTLTRMTHKNHVVDVYIIYYGIYDVGSPYRRNPLKCEVNGLSIANQDITLIKFLEPRHTPNVQTTAEIFDEDKFECIRRTAILYRLKESSVCGGVCQCVMSTT